MTAPAEVRQHLAVTTHGVWELTLPWASCSRWARPRATGRRPPRSAPGVTGQCALVTLGVSSAGAGPLRGAPTSQHARLRHCVMREGATAETRPLQSGDASYQLPSSSLK